MKRWYFLVALVSVAGLSLVVYATANTEAITLLGVTVQAHVIKGLGLIIMILSVLGCLAVYGNSLPSNRSEQRKRGVADAEDVSIRDIHPHRRLPTPRTVSRRSTLPSCPVDRRVLTKDGVSSRQ
jgi:hypothetical protein